MTHEHNVLSFQNLLRNEANEEDRVRYDNQCQLQSVAGGTALIEFSELAIDDLLHVETCQANRHLHREKNGNCNILFLIVQEVYILFVLWLHLYLLNGTILV